MCGIAGIFAYHRDSPAVETRELLHIRDAMSARGPDGAGIWTSKDGCVGLAHRRLAILDLSDAGIQPMVSANGRYQIVFNGEIYNFRELQAKLAARGYRFRSNTDTEVILCAYQEFGARVVEHLRGMFAFAIWDDERRGLFLARDHFGIKPLYYHDDGKTFRVASQVKAILAGGGLNVQPEPAGHVGYFLWGSVPEPYTNYRNLFALPAGHSLWVDQCGPRNPHKYFDIAEELEKAAAAPVNGNAAEVLKAALTDSVKHHLVADVPVGLFLSSGLDSSVLAAVMREHVSQVQAVTLGFDEYKDTAADEVPLAKIIAAHYDCAHHIARVSQSDFDNELASILNAMDQPSIDGVNTYFVARAAASKGVKVALSGVGADELLGGYPSFSQIPKMVSRFHAFSGFPKVGRLFQRVSAPFVKHVTSPKFAGLFEYGGTYGGAYLLRRGLFMPWELPRFLDGEFVREGWNTLQPILRMDEWQARIRSPHAKVAALEMAFYMRNMLLRDSDWAGMAHSLEIRTPFVDIALFRALASFLSSVTNCPAKRHLSGVPRIPLPDAILNRPKTGFSIPVREWMTKHGAATGERGLRGWSMHVNAPNLVRKQTESSGTQVLALVSDAYGGRGGIAKFNRDLLWSICACPSVSQVVAIPRHAPDAVEELPLKLRYDVTGINGKLAYIRTVWRSCMNIPRPSMVLCGHINLLPIAWLIASIKRRPLWCVIHGIDAWQPHKNGFVNYLLKHLDGVIAVSEVTRQRFTAWSGIGLEKVHILPNCYDPALFFPAPVNDLLLDRYGLHGKRILLTVGRISRQEQYKGFDEVIEALPHLIREVPNLAYLIVGDGDDKPRLKEKAKTLGVEDRVVFAGYIDESEKADHYRLADVYLMPSRGEGFGIVFLEALACGVPAIGSKLDGSREALGDGRWGILVDPAKPAEIHSAIIASLAKSRPQTSGGFEEHSLSQFKVNVGELLKLSEANVLSQNV